MKTIALLLLAATMTAHAGEAEQIANYNAMMESQRQAYEARLPSSALSGVPIKSIVEVGSLGYSIIRNPSTNPMALGTYAGAASSTLPNFTGWNLSRQLGNMGWR